MTPPVFFLASAADVAVGSTVTLDGAEGRHAADVRRLRAGERIGLTDGSGVMLAGVVTEARRGGLSAEVTERHVTEAPHPRFVVAQALARGGRDEDAVEAMTEVGVDEVLGWQAARCVAPWSDRTSSRWASTVHAAAKQSRRARWPVVSGPVSTADLAQSCAAAALAVLLHESAESPLTSLSVPRSGDVLLVVGPEGGIADEELAELSAAGAHPVRLGDGVLRSSTAGVVALAVLSAAARWT